MIPSTEHQVARPVAEDVFQVRLPLPFALNHVNCYLLRDADGWTILDSGLNQPAAIAVWETAWSELGIRRLQIHRILLTHMHPDHFGLAGWLQQETGAPVFLSPRERQLAQVTWLDVTPTEARRQAVARYLHSGGITPEVGDIIARQQDKLRSLTLPHPAEILTLEAGSTLSLAGRSFRTIHAPGHADGQLIFFSEADGLLLCGDQVLMGITPNIGVWPTTEPNPLRRYLHSLTALAALNVSLALPGHHRPITGWQARLAELQAHHKLRLDAMAEAAQAGATALEVSFAVFNYDRFSHHEVRFAVAETLAHLEYLAEEGRLERVEEPDRRLYRAA